VLTTSCDIGCSHNDIAKDPNLWVEKETLFSSLRPSTVNPEGENCL